MKFFYLLLVCFIFSNCYVYQAHTIEESDKIPSLKEQIKNNHFYKLKINNELYKVKAIEWEGDSLVTHVNFKEKNIKKFHKNDIAEVQQRTFARGRSDALTFGIYGGITALIILLTR